MAFRLTFLGTSAGMPTKTRFVSGLGVECLDNSARKYAPWLLIDCGEGIQYQLLKTPLKLNKLMAICITHLHGDHCFGVAGLLATMAMQGRREPLTLIAPQALSKLLDTYSLVCELYFDFPINFIAIEDCLATGVSLEIAQNHQLHIDFTALAHRIASYAFTLTQCLTTKRLALDKLRALNIDKDDYHHYKAQAEFWVNTATNCRLVVAGDNSQPELLASAVADAHALVHECTYTQAVLDKLLANGRDDPKHTTAKQIACFARQAGLPLLALTHFSPRYAPFDNPNEKQPNMGHIRAEIARYYSGQVVLAKDLLQVMIE